MKLPHDVLFESFTFPFFDGMYPIEASGGVVKALLASQDPNPQQGRRGIYIHIPFCETICHFCPFVKFVPRDGQIEHYVRSLEREAALVLSTPRIASWKIDSIYFGGGTPSLLSTEQVQRILAAIRSQVEVVEDVEVTFEAEPKSIVESKLRELKEVGVTRSSFGVQTFNQRLRDQVHLTAQASDIRRAIEVTTSVFANTNLDMIAGHPGQSLQDVETDMRLAATSGIGSVSMYPFDYVTALPSFLDTLRKGKAEVPTSSQRWEQFHAARATLADHLAPQNMYCFGRPEAPKCRYMFETLYGGYLDQALGLGCGSYSYLTGLIYQNDQRLANYQTAVWSDALPIVRANPVQALEKSFVYFPKRLYANLREADHLGIRDWIDPRVQHLENLGYVSVSSDQLRLTPLGERHYAQVMVYMLSEQQRRLYDRACARMAEGLNWGLDGARSIDTSRIRGLAAKSAVTAEVTSK